MKANPRRGMAVVEVVAACGVLLALMAVTAAVFAQNHRWRRAAERHAWAVSEASNCLERLSAEPWDALTPQRGAAEKFSPSVRDVLGPAATMTATVEPVAAAPEARRIVVEIRWTNDGRPAPPVRLTTWRYRWPAFPGKTGGQP